MKKSNSENEKRIVNVPLKIEMARKGLSVTKLAQKAEVGRVYLSFAVNGRNALKPDEKIRVANVLSVPTEHIFSAEIYE